MDKIACTLFCYSNSAHVQQLYTGFGLLQRQGIIDLSFQLLKERPPDLPGVGPNGLKVVINGEKLLFYDTFDGYQINPNVLGKVDFYFKRSFLPSAIDKNMIYRKVFPLGLNYLVYEGSPSFFSLKRTGLEKRFVGKIKNVFNALEIDRLVGSKTFFIPRVSNCFAYPLPAQPSRVLFMTHLWDPGHTSVKSELLGLSRESLEAVNEMRVKCIRALKKEFGDKFFGGVVVDEYSTRNFPDCLIQEARNAQKGNYLAMLPQYPVCVTTTGLFGSIGWKFAEYICFSWAIVSEKLSYEVPGLCGAGENYLEFTTPEGCVAAVSQLFEDRELLVKIMMNNYRYYLSYLRPDLLILNTLIHAMSAG